MRKDEIMSKPCRICGQNKIFSSLVSKDFFLGSKEEYGYVFCPICNSLSIEDIPGDLSDLYKNYYSFSPPSPISWLKFQIYKYIISKSNFISKFFCSILQNQEDLPIKSIEPIKIQKNSRILDVGCGSGTLLCLLDKMGFNNCIGIDPYLEKDINYSTGLSIKKQDFFDLNEKFDLIMFHHVFEHFSNPKDVIKQVHKLLSKNGICIIRIPDVDSYSFSRYKENWFSIHAPFHLFLPSKNAMEMLVKDTGLIIEDIIGEQLIEFFFYSMGHELGIADYEKYGNRKFIEEHGIKSIPPFHIKNELKDAKQRLKQVRKYNLCDWSIYYLKKEESNEVPH